MSDEIPPPPPSEQVNVVSKSPNTVVATTDIQLSPKRSVPWLSNGGRPLRMLLESEILAAQSVSKTEKQVAKKLGVSYITYQKYAKMYGIYGRVMNRAGKGINKPIKNENSGRYPLDRILNGEFPDYPMSRFRVRLIRSGTMKAECCKCGFHEVREADKQAPIVLAFKDGNKKNKRLENLEMYCYNCYFLHINNPHGRPNSFSVDGGADPKDNPPRE
jgi:hypothetical protein